MLNPEWARWILGQLKCEVRLLLDTKLQDIASEIVLSKHMTAPQKSIDSSESESRSENLAVDGQSLVCGDIEHMWREVSFSGILNTCRNNLEVRGSKRVDVQSHNATTWLHFTTNIEGFLTDGTKNHTRGWWLLTGIAHAGTLRPQKGPRVKLQSPWCLGSNELGLGGCQCSSKDFEVGCAGKGFWFQFKFPRINLSFGSNRRLVTCLDFFHV
jgi:hypothetical protein